MSFLKKEVNSANIKIAAVCGDEVSIFDKMVGQRRKLLRVRKFPNHGKALQFAQNFDEVQQNIAVYGA
jgi:DNA polymerase II small subunit/DNA polymerase delta subunit B